uniref:Uncharacterized protein n=1 Tax=uncultured bacterium A1Q1_fos_2116 TaxID=1256564 RepID=L7VRY6_9BACT|nr:hypothetical protein [uncultured bacterium A1Q1_fos_2116]
MRMKESLISRANANIDGSITASSPVNASGGVWEDMLWSSRGSFGMVLQGF